ncbi:MAG: hypothetical protein V1773_18045 [bacterium]
MRGEMEPLNINVDSKFVIKIFLDTNVLMHLLDNRYKNLNAFIDFIRNNSFIRLVSSEYAIFELIGTRQREHYFRQKISSEGLSNTNISDLFKQYRNKIVYSEYEKYANQILECVNNDINRISEEFEINFRYSGFHRGQLIPIMDLVCNVCIDNQDSLILTSAMLPESDSFEKDIIFFTNDETLEYIIQSRKTLLHDALVKHGINCPIPFESKFKQKLLNKDRDLNQDEIILFISTVLRQQNEKLFLGYTFIPRHDPGSCIVVIKVKKDGKIPSNFTIAIVDKNLTYYYATNKISNFQLSGKPVDENTIFTEDQNIVSFKIEIQSTNVDDNAEQLDLIRKIKEGGNLVFIHPDDEVAERFLES